MVGLFLFDITLRCLPADTFRVKNNKNDDIEIESFAQRIAGLGPVITDLFFKHVIAFVISIITISCLGISYLVYIYEKDAQGANITSYWDAIWWSVVTVLTIGYGDRFPITPEGRSIAFSIMFVGITLMGVVTAKVSSVFLERALRDRRGFVEKKNLKDHLIICGWKEEMYSFLARVIEANPDMPHEKIILVNNIHDEDIEALFENPVMANLKHVKGDFFSKPVLERAAPHRAKKIIILADATPGTNGTKPTLTEADARTIMAAMTLSNIAKGVPVVAEILDASMDQYLKLAHVNEIIYTRDYSRMLLAKSSNGIGIPNIFHQLLSTDSNFFITTRPFSEGLNNISYKDFKLNFEQHHPGAVLLGILENSGNSHSIKELALKRAQKTPDIKQLVDNLQTVKSLKFNNPVFAPKDTYIVPEGSLAIVIETKKDMELQNGAAA